MNRVNKKEIQNIGNLFILASAILFSLAGVLIKMISWSPITINGMRNIFAFIVMLIYLKKTVHKIVINKIV
jgi:drug/metabolite transporter (DMT)-like permease